MIEEILGFARKLWDGELDETLLLPLCQAAERELGGRLRTGLVPADCGPAFSVAAAWLALAGLDGGGAAAGVSSFSAGDLTIRTDRSGAEIMRRQAQRLMAPYLSDGGFAFQGVRG